MLGDRQAKRLWQTLASGKTLAQAATGSQPFPDQPIGLGFAGGGFPDAHVVVLAAQSEHGLACGLVTTVLRNAKSLWHGDLRFPESGRLPVYRERTGRAAERQQVF